MSRNSVLWTMQVLLALVFVIAGITKLIVPIEALSMPISLSGPMIRAIGMAEVLGAIGLVMPWGLRIMPMLTPVAATCLAVIVTGASVTTVRSEGVGPAVFPLVLTMLCAMVALGRSLVRHGTR